MVTEMGEEGAVPTVSISEQGDGVAWLRKSAALASPWAARKSPFIMPGLPDLELDKIVSIPKLEPLDPSMLAVQRSSFIPQFLQTWSLRADRGRGGKGGCVRARGEEGRAIALILSASERTGSRRAELGSQTARNRRVLLHNCT